VHTAIGICHTGYVDCLLANSQLNLYVWEANIFLPSQEIFCQI